MRWWLRAGVFGAGLFGVLSLLAGIGFWEGAEVIYSFMAFSAGTFALLTAAALVNKLRQQSHHHVLIPVTTAPTTPMRPRKTLRGAFIAVVIIVVVVNVFDGWFGTEKTWQGESLPASARANFANYVLAELGTPAVRCDAAAESDKRITWICGDDQRGYDTFIRNWERLTASTTFQTQYSLTPESDWLYYAQDDGSADFYGRFFHFNGEMFLASYNVADNPGDGDKIFLGFGDALSSVPARATGVLSR